MPFGLVTASVLGGLVMPVDDGQIEIGRRVVDGPISTVAVCTMGNTECKACMSASARYELCPDFRFWGVPWTIMMLSVRRVEKISIGVYIFAQQRTLVPDDSFHC